MKTGTFDDGIVYYPDDDEKEVLESLVEMKLAEYAHGGFWLTKKGQKICKKLFKQG